MALRILFCFILISLLTGGIPSESFSSDYAVLVHGLARTGNSMRKLEKTLSQNGYNVINIEYPSRKYSVEELAIRIRKEIDVRVPGDSRIHFVTHSMGGIIVRYIQKNMPLPHIGRVVMLSPPNHGSEVVDKLGDLSIFKWLNGPAGRQLGTGKKGVWRELGKPDFETGVITGDRSINWINSRIIPGMDDGKVSLESARLEGMRDFLVVHASHSYIMRNNRVIRQCVNFLKQGHFEPE